MCIVYLVFVLFNSRLWMSAVAVCKKKKKIKKGKKASRRNNMAGPDIKTKAQCDSESLMCRQILHVCRPRFVRSRLSVAARGEGGLHFHFPHMHYVAAAAPGRVRRHQPEWSSTSDTCFPQRIPFHQRWLTPRTVCPSGRLAWECCMVKLANGFPKFALCFLELRFFKPLSHVVVYWT